MNRRVCLAMLSVGLLLAGCSQQAMFERFIPRDDVVYAKELFRSLQAHEFSAVEDVLNPELRNADARRRLEEVASVFPAEQPRDVKVIGAHTAKFSDKTYVNLTLEYEFPSGWVLGNLVLEKRPGRNLVNGLHSERALDSQERLNRFGLSGKTGWHYLILVWASAAPLFIGVVLIIALRTRIARGKWLWIAFILFGVCQVSLNWTTGELGLNPISVVLLATGFTKLGPYGPVIISSSIPLGAAVFLWKRRAVAKTPLQPAPSRN